MRLGKRTLKEAGKEWKDQYADGDDTELQSALFVIGLHFGCSTKDAAGTFHPLPVLLAHLAVYIAFVCVRFEAVLPVIFVTNCT